MPDETVTEMGQAPTRAMFAVDWDNTCVTEVWPGMGDWLPGAIEALRELASIGKTVIYTLRIKEHDLDDETLRDQRDVQNEIDAVRFMLDAAGLEEIDIYPTAKGKPPAKFYIDDRALRFEGDWKTMLRKVHVATRRPETLIVNEKTGGVKASKIQRYDLLAWGALDKLAEVYGQGAQKYEDRNWEKGYDWGLSLASLFRHVSLFAQGENDDPESGLPHLAHAAWHALTLLTFMEHHPELDNRTGLRKREDFDLASSA